MNGGRSVRDLGVVAHAWRVLAVSAVATATLVVAPVAGLPGADPAHVVALATDVALQTLSVSPDTTVTAAGPGQVFTYVLGFSCDSTQQTTCAGAVVDDVLPTFTDVFGNTSQLLQNGSITSTPSIWASGPTFSGTAPNVKVTGTLGSGAAAGQTYSLSFQAKAPIGLFPTGTTTVTDQATATGGKTSPSVQSRVAATSPAWTVQKTGPATLLLGANGTYTIKACPSPTTAAFPPSFSLSDLLPVGATFVSASNGGIGPVGIANGTSDAVAWTLDSSMLPWTMSGNCVAVSTVVKFVEDPDPAVNNVTSVNKVDTASGTYGPSATSLGSAQVTTGLRGPITGIGASKSVGVGGYYVKTGDAVRYDLGWSNTSEAGAAALDGATLVDDLTSITGVQIDSIDTGTWSGAVTAAVETFDGSTWTALAGSPFDGAGHHVVAPGGITKIRWTFTGTLPVGFATSGIRLGGTVTDSGNPATTPHNCLDASATRGATTFTSNGHCADVHIELPQPDPSVAKSITAVVAADAVTAHTASTVAPGDTITYRVRVSNSADATGDLTDPAVTDCAAVTDYLRDPVIALGTSWTLDGAYTDATCTGNGGTPLRFVYGGGPIAPGQTVTAATYTVVTTQFGDAEGVTLAGDYPNTAHLAPAGGGSYTHGTFASTATARVPAYVYLASQKSVLGALDEPIPHTGPGPDGSVNAGQTNPGARLSWYLTVQNRGNVPAKDPVYVDVFPFVGDTGVKRTDQQRNSEWAPYLVSPIVAPNGWTVEYSTSQNPCRPEIGPTPSSATPWPNGCETPAWSTDTSLFALTTYRSIRLKHTGNIAVDGGSLTFHWEMRAPVYDPSYDLVNGQPGTVTTDPYERLGTCHLDPDTLTQDPSTTSPCPRAVNSFAWASEPDPNSVSPALNPGRLSTEPPRAGIQVTAPPLGNGIGDRAWYDTNFDGLQDPGEVGVPGVYVELLKHDTTFDTWPVYGFTYTDANGNYLFANSAADGSQGLPDGEYKVRFYLPSQWTPSPRDADGKGATDLGTPANGDTDSDAPRLPSGTGSSGAVAGIDYYETTAVTLAGNELDRTWDVGLWRAQPSISVVKVTKDTAWPDDQAGDGVTVLQGRPLTWIYTLTNTGNARLQNVTVTDDNGTSGNSADDRAVTSCTITSDGINGDGLHSSATVPMVLNRGATMECRLTGTAGSSAYTNVVHVSGDPRLDDGTTITHGSPPAHVTATDPSSYQVAKYDLALMKTVGTPDFATGNVVYTITVKNQGTVASGVYDVTDTLPAAGMSFVSSNPASTAPTAGTRRWSGLASLAPAASATLTLTLRVDDWTTRPWRNTAEISADSSAAVVTGGVTTPTHDIDSTPDTDPTNDMPNPKTYGPIGNPTAGGADNTSINQAGTGTDGEDDADIADLNPSPTYDLALAKTVNATGLAANGDGTVVYTITVKNQGNVDSGTYHVTDTMPLGMAPVTPVAGSGVVTAGSGSTPTTVLWTGTNLTPGSTATFTLTATISDVTKRDFRNVAEISSDSAQALYGVDDVDSTPDANTGNDMPNPKTYGAIGHAVGHADNLSIDDAGTGTDGEDDADIADLVLPLANGYDLALSKTVDQSQVSFDHTIVFTITVQNQGVLDSRQFTVTDHVPDGLSVTSLDGGTDHHDGTITWTVTNLAPGASLTRTLQATVADITKRPFRNIAEISADSAATYSSTGEVVHDRDSTPDAITTNDGTYGPIMNAGAIDNVDTGSGPVVAAIESAGVGADSPGSGGEDDADIADVDVPVTYDLALVKTGPTTFDATGTAAFTITVANQGNVPSGPYDVTDTVPLGMTATAASDGGSLTAPTAHVVWTALPSLAPGATASVTVTMQVTDWTKRPFTNAAEITHDSSSTYSTGTVTVHDVDSVPGDEATSSVDNTSIDQAGVGPDAGFDDEDIAVVGIDPVYDLALVKTVDQPTAVWNGAPAFTITVVNQGNVPSGPITVTDVIPPGTHVESADTGGTVTGNGTIVTWALPSIPAGASAVVHLTVRIDDLTKRPYRNSAEITADGSAAYTLPGGPTVHDVDSVPGDEATSSVDITTIDQAGVGGDAGFDDEDTAVVDVPITYDLALVKTLEPGQNLKKNSVIRYDLTVTNQGNVPSMTYSVEDALPQGLTFVAASDGGVATGQLVDWVDLPSLAPGTSKVLTVDVRIVDTSRSSYINVAGITKDGTSSLSTPLDPVVDVDSQPVAPLLDPRPVQDSHASAVIPIEDVVKANVPLPGTGADVRRLLAVAGGLLGMGSAVMLVDGRGVRRRRRRRRAASRFATRLTDRVEWAERSAPADQQR